VSKRMHRECRGVKGGGARPPLWGCRGVDPTTQGPRGPAPEKQIFASGNVSCI
jgi:hypothetical protein